MAAAAGGKGTRSVKMRAIWRDVLMVSLAILSIGVLAAEEWADLTPVQSRNLLYLDLAIVAVFWVEYVYRYRAATDKKDFLKRSWYDLPGMVPILPGMESIAGVRVLRLLRVLRILRLLGALSRFDRFNQFFERFTRKSKLGYVAGLALSIIVACAILAWSFEPQTFPTLGDALWWGVVTATTVGYGDFFPKTGLVRAVAVVLMFLGVGLIGTFAATLSSTLVEHRFEGDQKERASAQPPGPALPVAFALPAELERLSRLHERGELTDAEYAAAKKRLLE